MNYVLVPEGMPTWYFCGWPVGFNDVERSAIKYVSMEIAKIAAAIVQESVRKQCPRHRAVVVMELP